MSDSRKFAWDIVQLLLLGLACYILGYTQANNDAVMKTDVMLKELIIKEHKKRGNEHE